MRKFKDYYAVLGVAPRSHARSIEETYWNRAHELHQEMHAEPTKKLQRKLHQINEAYEVLGSPYKRAAYDRKRHEAVAYDAGPARPTFFQSFVMVLRKPYRPD